MPPDPKDHESAITALHSTAEAFMRAETPEAVAETAVDAIRDIIGLPMNGVYLYNDTTHQLRPVAWTERGEAVVGKPPVFGPGDGLAWRAFESGTPEIHADVSSVPGRLNPDTAIGSEIILPLDNHGVVIIGSDKTDAFDDVDISLAQTVASHMTAVLGRIEREETLKRRNERLDGFASIVSHDLRNPLNVAEGYLEMAQANYDGPELAEVAQSLDRMNALIDDLLMLAQEGSRVTDLEPVALADAAETCWQNVPTADATLVVETNQTIRADRSRLRQLLANVFRNAVEHGGTAVRITVGPLEGGFYVADDGAGVSPGERERVFDQGYSADSDGTGVGLAIVAKIADGHGWTVEVTDSTDGGARFEFTGVEGIA